MANFIKSYQELEAAFRFKRKNPAYPEYRFKDTGIVRFEGENGIFDQARTRFFNRFPLPADNMKMVDQILKTIDAKDVSLEQYLNPHQTLPSQPTPVEISQGEQAATMTGATPSVSSRLPSMPNIAQNIPRVPTRVANIGKDIGSSGSVFFKKGTTSIAQGLGSIIGDLGRSGGGIGLRILNGTADRVQALSSIQRPGFKVPGTAGAKFAWALGIFFLIVLLMGIVGGITGTTPFGETAPIPKGLASSSAGSIAACEFIQHGKTFKVGTNKLQSLFEEVSARSGVPASLLAAIAFQETFFFTIRTNENDPIFSVTDFPSQGCDPYFPTSETGALGLMQVQPPASISTYGSNYNPNAADLNGIKLGLSFLDRDPSSLTKNDFCNVRNNIYLAAGIIIDKNGGKAPTTANEARSIACSYMGACQIGPYSYADEVKQGVEQCKAAPQVAEASDCPIPNGRIQCGSQFTPLNGCGHCGVKYGGDFSNCTKFEGTKYALDVDAAVSQPVYLPKVSGEVIQWDYRTPGGTIQKYAGTGVGSHKKYYLQLHHTRPGSSNPKGGLAGEIGAVIGTGTNHLHIQIGEGGNNQADTKWLDAAQYFCRNK